MKMDDLGNPIENVYIRKVERVGGKLQNTVIHTYPERLAVLDLQAGRVPEARRPTTGTTRRASSANSAPAGGPRRARPPHGRRARGRPGRGGRTIRVGFLGPLTGIFAQAGKDMLDGLKMALEQARWQAGGRKIELIEEDNEGNPATAVAKYRKLVEPRPDPRAHRRPARQHRLRPGAPHRARPAAHAVPHHARTTSPSASRRSGSSAPTSRQPAHAPARRLRGEDAQVQAGGRPRDGQRLRPRGDRRLPAGLRGRRRPGGPEDLGAAQRAGLRARTSPRWPRTSTRCARSSSPARRSASSSSTARAGLKGKIPLIGTGVMIDENALRSMGDEAVGTIGTLIWSPTLHDPRQPDLHEAGRGACSGARPPTSTRHVQQRALDRGGRRGRSKGNVEDREKLPGRHPAGHRDHRRIRADPSSSTSGATRPRTSTS